jgi:hypothetical protein
LSAGTITNQKQLPFAYHLRIANSLPSVKFAACVSRTQAAPHFKFGIWISDWGLEAGTAFDFELNFKFEI